MRIGVTSALAVLVVALAAVHALWPREEGPPTEVETLMRVHENLLEALAEESFDEIWDLLAVEQREQLERHLEWALEHPNEDYVIGMAELRAMDTRTFLEVGLSKFVERYPEEWRDGIARLRSLRIEEVGFNGGSGFVRHAATDVEPDKYLNCFLYVREDGAWRFLGLTGGSALPFKTLEHKVEAFLPKVDWPELEEEIRIVVTIGSEGLAPEGVGLLAARLREWAEVDFMSPVLLDLAPRVSWDSAIRATDACLRAGYWEIRFAVATTAGPGPGVRVNGVPVTEPFDVGVVDIAAVRRAMTIGDRRGQPVEVRLSCPNPATDEGVPWVFETSFTNLGVADVRAFRMRSVDPTVRIVLETIDPEALEAVEPEARIEPEPPPERPQVGDDGEEDAVIYASPPDPRARIVLGPAASGPDRAAERVVLSPGERLSRFDVARWRPGKWTAHAEILDANGQWIRSAAVRLSGADEAGATDSLAALSRTVRTDPEPARSLLAALAARRLSEDEGRRLLREIVEGAGVDPALREAAARLLE